jgi:hypothetical protein
MSAVENSLASILRGRPNPRVGSRGMGTDCSGQPHRCQRLDGAASRSKVKISRGNTRANRPRRTATVVPSSSASCSLDSHLVKRRDHQAALPGGRIRIREPRHQMVYRSPLLRIRQLSRAPAAPARSPSLGPNADAVASNTAAQHRVTVRARPKQVATADHFAHSAWRARSDRPSRAPAAPAQSPSLGLSADAVAPNVAAHQRVTVRARPKVGRDCRSFRSFCLAGTLRSTVRAGFPSESPAHTWARPRNRGRTLRPAVCRCRQPGKHACLGQPSRWTIGVERQMLPSIRRESDPRTRSCTLTGWAPSPALMATDGRLFAPHRGGLPLGPCWR